REHASSRRASRGGSGAGYADGAGDAGAAQPAVSVGILREVLLVVVLGVVEGPRLCDLGGDLAVACSGESRLVRACGGFRGGVLGLVEVQDRGAVLGAAVVALAHPLGGVVAL